MKNGFPRFLFQFLIAALIIGAFVFFGGTEAGAGMRGFFGSVASPLARVSGSFAAAWRGVAGGGSGKEYDGILAENQRLKALLLELDSVRRENDELRQALAFSKEKNVQLRGAPVLLYSEEFGKELLVIGAGADDGVRKGDIILDENGILVGIVEEAEPSYSNVGIASNSGMTFEVEFVPLGVRALAKGLGAGTFAIEFLPPETIVNPGDYIAATASGYPPFVLGEITRSYASASSAFLEARAVRLARPERMASVFVASVPEAPRKK